MYSIDFIELGHIIYTKKNPPKIWVTKIDNTSLQLSTAVAQHP